MSELDKIVKVNITREVSKVTQAGFGVPAIIATFDAADTTTPFTRARYYTSVGEMLEDGWETTSVVYQKAAAVFNQNPQVTQIMVGRLDEEDESVAAGLNAILDEQQNWYAVLVADVEGMDLTTLTDYVAWVQANKKLLFWATDTPEVLDATSDSDVAAAFHAAGYDRAVIIWNARSVNDVPQWADAAWCGECLPYDPGSQTWCYKTLVGVAADELSSSKEEAAWAKGANTYQTKGGVSITQQGTVASGEYIDIIRGLDWLEARLQEAIYGLLTSARKVPYDDSGITLVVSYVNEVLKRAENAGVLQADSSEVTAPLYAEIPVADKANRHLPDIKFTATLLGAIHTVKIDGVVSL